MGYNELGKNPRWNGGIKFDSNGYLRERIGVGKYKYTHRIAYENFLGRSLMRNEVIHHKNGDKTDNRLENLELLTLSQHTKIHNKRRFSNAMSNM